MKTKSTIKLFTVVFLILILSSCGGKKESNEIKPQTNAIEGYLSDYLEVVPGTYKADKDNEFIFNWVVKVKLKAKAVYAADSDYGFNDGNYGPLYLDLYDSKGIPIAGFDNLGSDFQDKAKLINILKKGSGETWVTFKKAHDYGKEELPDDVSAFAINSKLTEKPETSSASNSSDNSSTSDETTSTGNEDIDKVLDDYDNYVDEYLKFYKKAKEGDNSAIAEYPSMLEKAQELQSSLEKAKTAKGLSPEQMQRMVKIETKMMKEAMKN